MLFTNSVLSEQDLSITLPKNNNSLSHQYWKVGFLLNQFRNEMSVTEALDLFLYRKYPESKKPLYKGIMNLYTVRSFYESLTCFDIVKLSYDIIYQPCTFNPQDLPKEVGKLFLFTQKNNISIFAYEYPSSNLAKYCTPHLENLRDTFWTLAIMSNAQNMVTTYWRSGKFLDTIVNFFLRL
jgi:hypothetical protein